MWFWAVTGIGAQEALDRLSFLLGPSQLAAFLHGPVGEYISKRAKARFASEGDDVTGPWKPLSPATVEIRLSQNFGGEHPINVRTGQLEDWVVNSGWRSYPTSLGASMAYPGSAPVGLTREKMQVAQGGGGAFNAPARPVLGLNENDLAAFAVMFTDYIEEGIR